MSKPMTATEVMERKDERDVILARLSRSELIFHEAQVYSDAEMTDAHYDEGAALRALIKEEQTKNEAARTSLVKPLNDHVRFINGQFKPSTDRLRDAIALVDKAMIPWAVAKANRQKIERAPTVATEHGTTAVRRTWDFEVVDPKKVPRRYRTIDEKAIRRDVNAGKRRIAGVRIFQRAGLSTQTR